MSYEQQDQGESPQPAPPEPDWDAIADRLTTVGELDQRWLTEVAALRADGTRATPLSVADLDRARAAAALPCVVDAANLWDWGQWAAHRIAELEETLSARLADLKASEQERKALLARASHAETLAVAAGAAKPNPDGPGLVPDTRRRRVTA